MQLLKPGVSGKSFVFKVIHKRMEAFHIYQEPSEATGLIDGWCQDLFSLSIR